ncbi:MAG: hypothetical protein EOM52_09595 [Clostridia bacterium]|nr:hypothetical protein [Clostridia bacterium]
MKKKLAAFLCAAALFCGLALPEAMAAWDDGLIFIAVNIRLLPLAEFMPITVNGSVYVPVTVFDANSNGGVSLGVYNGGINKTFNTYTLYNNASKFLTFDLSTGNSYDYYPDGAQQNCRAVVRNGKIYVSLNAVCRYFDLDSSYTNPAYRNYPMVRIKSKDSPLYSDTEFVNAASTSAMLSTINEYYKTVTQEQPAAPVIPAPTPSGSVTPAPSDVNHSNIVFRLAVRMETGQAGGAILDVLRGEGRSALLLFTPEQIAAQDDLVRRAIGEGHSIGLLVPGGSAKEAQEGIRRGNELLSHVGRIRTRMILADGADAATRKTLEEEGWLCWNGNIDGVPGRRTGYTTANEVMKLAGEKKSLAAVTMDDSTASGTAISTILRTLRQEKFSYRAMVETEF